MSGKLNIVGHRITLFLVALLLGITTGIATVSISGDFYNADDSTSFTEIGENVNTAGCVLLMPSGGFDQFPYSIYASGSASTNQVAAPVKFSASVSASGDGKSFSTNAMLTEDAGIAPVLNSKWSYSTTLGGTARLNGIEENSFDQVLNIATVTGYGTFPTSSNYHPSATGGVTSRGFDDNGKPLFDTQYLPPLESGFGYPLTVGVYYAPGAHFENKMELHVKW